MRTAPAQTQTPHTVPWIHGSSTSSSVVGEQGSSPGELSGGPSKRVKLKEHPTGLPRCSCHRRAGDRLYSAVARRRYRSGGVSGVAGGGDDSLVSGDAASGNPS